jgi:hypothetical protein
MHQINIQVCNYLDNYFHKQINEKCIIVDEQYFKVFLSNCSEEKWWQWYLWLIIYAYLDDNCYKCGVCVYHQAKAEQIFNKLQIW